MQRTQKKVARRTMPLRSWRTLPVFPVLSKNLPAKLVCTIMAYLITTYQWMFKNTVLLWKVSTKKQDVCNDISLTAPKTRSVLHSKEQRASKWTCYSMKLWYDHIAHKWKAVYQKARNAWGEVKSKPAKKLARHVPWKTNPVSLKWIIDSNVSQMK